MEWLALVTGLVGAVLWGLKLLYNWQAKKAGRMEEKARAQEELLDDIELATRVEEAHRHNDDPDWARRVRDKYRRD